MIKLPNNFSYLFLIKWIKRVLLLTLYLLFTPPLSGVCASRNYLQYNQRRYRVNLILNFVGLCIVNIHGYFQNFTFIPCRRWCIVLQFIKNFNFCYIHTSYLRYFIHDTLSIDMSFKKVKHLDRIIVGSRIHF